jgi:hypothetical protein
VPDDLDMSIQRALAAMPNRSAHALALEMGVSRTQINSALYHGLGRIYALTGDAPPLWRLLVEQSSASRAIAHPEPLVHPSETVHIDFSGGDWELSIAVRPASRNDPIAIVETIGPRKRAVIVSDYVIPKGDAGATGTLHPAVLTVAASMLAWEIADHLNERGHTGPFDFGRAVRDIYLSLLAHTRKNGA